MTSSALGADKAASKSWPRLRSLWRHRAIADRAPVIIVVAALISIWYVAAVVMNIGLVRDAFEREETAYGLSDLVGGSLNAERPLVAAPHQVLGQFIESVFDYPPDSPRSLVYHGYVTLSAALLGFALGGAFGTTCGAHCSRADLGKEPAALDHLLPNGANPRGGADRHRRAGRRRP